MAEDVLVLAAVGHDSAERGHTLAAIAGVEVFERMGGGNDLGRADGEAGAA